MDTKFIELQIMFLINYVYIDLDVLVNITGFLLIPHFFLAFCNGSNLEFGNKNTL